MSFLSWIFRCVPKEERDGLSLDDSDCWEVTATRDGSAWLRALPRLVPIGSILYCEDTTEEKVERFLCQHQVEAPVKIGVGTIWPVPDRHHMPLTEENIGKLAELVEDVAILSIHVHVYKGSEVLLQWHDAFTDDPMYVSRVLPEERVKAFADTLGCGYRQVRGAS